MSKSLQGTINGVYSYLGNDGLPWVIVDERVTEADLDPVFETTVPGESVCGFRWMASRVDTVHETVPVLHVCDLPEGPQWAEHEHRCGCGASNSPHSTG